MTAYNIRAEVWGRNFLRAGETDRQIAGGVRPQSSWRNPYWAQTPDWARKVFDNLSEFLARPTFWNGIMVGDGQAPYRDPETGEMIYPLPPALVQGNNPAASKISLQSDDWNPFAPSRGWRLDRSGSATFDFMSANAINSRGDFLHFQFHGSAEAARSDNPLGFSRNSIYMRSDGAMGAPLISSEDIVNQSLVSGALSDLWLQWDCKIDANGIVTAPDMYARGQQVSVAGHAHAYDPSGTASTSMAAHVAAADPHPGYLTLAEGDARYSLVGHTHSGLGGYGGLATFVTVSSGFAQFNHGLGFTPSWAVVQHYAYPSGDHYGGSATNVVVHEMTSTYIKVKIHNADGSTAIIGSPFSYVAFTWTAGA